MLLENGFMENYIVDQACTVNYKENRKQRGQISICDVAYVIEQSERKVWGCCSISGVCV